MKFWDCRQGMILWYDLMFHMGVPWISYLIPVVEPSNCFQLLCHYPSCKVYICRNKSLCPVLMVSLGHTSRSVTTLHKGVNAFTTLGQFAFQIAPATGALLCPPLSPTVHLRACSLCPLVLLFTKENSFTEVTECHWMSLNCETCVFSSWPGLCSACLGREF